MPQINVSWGELFDRMAILNLKSLRLKDHAAASRCYNEYNELAVLDRTGNRPTPLPDELWDALLTTNAAIWDAEDAIRKCEAEQKFDEKFVALARKIYRLNDSRSLIKRKINELMNSQGEEKQYTPY